MNKNIIIAVLVVGIIGALFVSLSLGYAWGKSKGYKVGYDAAIVDAKATQEALAKKAAEEAAAAANPFKVANPLEGVEANPFQETAKKLNPF